MICQLLKKHPEIDTVNLNGNDINDELIKIPSKLFDYRLGKPYKPHHKPVDIQEEVKSQIESNKKALAIQKNFPMKFFQNKTGKKENGDPKSHMNVGFIFQ